MNAIRKQEEKHTPEPWACTKAGPVMNGYSQGDAICSIEHKTLIAGCFSDVRGGPEVAEYNARRIVACVNACSGMNTETLEIAADGGPNVKEWFQGWGEGFKIEKQRDELLEIINEFLQLRDWVIKAGGTEGPLPQDVINKFAEMQHAVTERALVLIAKATQRTVVR